VLHRLTVFGYAFLAAVGTQPAHAQIEASARVEAHAAVHITNNASVPSRALDAALTRAAEVFRRIGVRLRWLDRLPSPSEPPPAPYLIVLLSADAVKANAARHEIPDAVIGQAIPPARRAYIYYQRIRTMSLKRERDVSVTLGYAIAHELGHLMLPPNSHSQGGIMRESFDFSPTLVTFTPSEKKIIRARLFAEQPASPNDPVEEVLRR